MRGQCIHRVVAAGIPQHPLVEAGVVYRLDLRAHVRRTVPWRAQREILQPGPDRRGARHACRPPQRVSERRADGPVRLGVRVPNSVGAAREV